VSDEPTVPPAEPIEPMSDVEFVTRHPALARALAELAVPREAREVPPAVPRSSRVKASARADRD
jgi:hypothetical protein